MAVRDRRLLLLLSAFAAGFMVLDLLLGLCTGALHFGPFFALLIPLLVGHYPGEARIARAQSRQRWDAARPQPCWPLAAVAGLSGRLGISELVSRPPPHFVLVSA